ncbi:MAG: metallophosphoesterase family protein [Longimicrobiales bacterium]
MRIGLISDTHGRLRPEVFHVFAGVDRIIHAGDVGSPDILVELAAIAEVTAVIGNTDGFDLIDRLPEQTAVDAAGWRIEIEHGHRIAGGPRPAPLRERHPDADVIVYGHTHRPLEDRAGGAIVVNPGAAGPPRFDLRPSVAILSLNGDRATVAFHEL